MTTKKNSGFDTQMVSDLAQILRDTDLTEIEVEQGEMRVRVSREPAPQYVTHSAPVAAPSAPSTAPAAPSTAPAAAANGDATAPAATHDKSREVPAPMVGTIYLAPAPDADNFIKVGSQVKEGETLLIIEAMKVMNQIAAPHSGKVTQLFVEDGDPVEYGQPMLVIE